jgi:hypothetical protein
VGTEVTVCGWHGHVACATAGIRESAKAAVPSAACDTAYRIGRP